MLTRKRTLWTSTDWTTPPPATIRRRIAETSSHSWRKYLRRKTSLESCSSSPTAVGSAKASTSAGDPVGSDGAVVAALDTQAAGAAAVAPVSCIAGIQGLSSTISRGTGGVRGCATLLVLSLSVFAVRRRLLVFALTRRLQGASLLRTVSTLTKEEAAFSPSHPAMQRHVASGRPSGTDGSDFSYRMVVESRNHPPPTPPKPRFQRLFHNLAILQGTRGSPRADPASRASSSCR